MVLYHRLALWTAVLAVSGTLIGILYATGSGAPLDASGIPSGMATRVELSLSNQEEIRTVELYPDGITAKHSLATHKDGSVTNYWYRPDSTLERAVTDGPADADGKRPRLRYAEVAPDGITYKVDIEYLADGSKSKETRLTDDGKEMRTYFHTNGIERRVQELAHDNRGWRLVQENLFREDRSLSQTMRTADGGAWERSFFNERSVLTNKKAMGPYDTRYSETFYQADGVTKKSEMEQNSQRTIVTTFRANGTRMEERTWSGAVASSSIKVIRFDSADKPLMQQWWTYRENKTFLWLVKVMRPKDGTLWKTVYFEADGSEITEIVYDGDGEMTSNYTRLKYGKDRRLVSTEKVVKNETVSTTTAPADSKVRFSLPADYTALSDMPPPPQVIPYVPAPMGGP